MRRSLLALTCLLALASVGCQKQTIAQREQKTESKICTQLTNVGKALDQVAALTPTSTVGDAEKAQKNLVTALNGLEKSEKALQKARVRELRDQLKTFNKEVDKVAKQKKLTLEQAAQELRTKAQPVIAARQQALAEVECVEEPAATMKK